jgi:hypothetical protein
MTATLEQTPASGSGTTNAAQVGAAVASWKVVVGAPKGAEIRLFAC